MWKWNKSPDTFLGCEQPYADARIVVFGAPWDSTTSFRPGTRLASRMMRGDSWGLETYSPFQDRDLEDVAIHDGGDLELPFGDTEATLGQIESFTEHLLSDGKLPCMIGGEHLLSLGAIRAAVRRWPELCIVHFDAHTDLRDELLGVPLSHATVMRRAWELTGDGRIYQFGIRSGERAEFTWAKEHTRLRAVDFAGLPEAVAALGDRPVYLSIDLDVLDSGVFPGTGTPEAGGVTFRELQQAIVDAARANVVACDVMELCPPLDPSGASTAAACKALRELLLALR